MQSQIYLIGNILLWYSSLVGLISQLFIFIWFMIRRRRKFYDLNPQEWGKFTLVTRVSLIGYLLNFLPYFFLERSLFLHHYLPALIFQHLIFVALIEFTCNQIMKSNFVIKYNKTNFSFLINSSIIVLISLFTYCFINLLPLSYGSGNLSADGIRSMKWRNSWHFITHDT